MASGIKDKVAIIGMGCSRFGERWDCNAEDLMLEAYLECLEDAGIETPQIEAAWLGLCYDEQSMSKSAMSLPQALRLANVPVTRVENLCATGSEALRGAVYAVAAGACDIALAMGVEKLKDTGFGGLPGRSMGTFDDLWLPGITAPGSFAQICTAYSAKHGISIDELKQAMAHVSWKSHENGARNPKAHLRNRVTEEQILQAPMISYPLGMFDCCGVSDGAACAIVTTPERAREMGRGHDLVAVAAAAVVDQEALVAGFLHRGVEGGKPVLDSTPLEKPLADAFVGDQAVKMRLGNHIVPTGLEDELRGSG